MELILWRHAEAEDGSDDLARALTRRGQQQAARMARWLRERLPRSTRVMCSEARRSVQTASALTKSYEIVPVLNPGASLPEILRLVNWLGDDEVVVLVGHQPWLGELASTLMSGEAQYWAVKKGGVWWLQHRQRDGVMQVRLQAMMTPGML